MYLKSVSHGWQVTKILFLQNVGILCLLITTLNIKDLGTLLLRNYIFYLLEGYKNIYKVHVITILHVVKFHFDNDIKWVTAM